MGTPKNQQRESSPKTSYVVHLIESPTPEELLAGREERKALGQVLSQLGIEHHAYLVIDAQRFADAAISIAKNTAPGKVPIIHISAHGNESGIALTDGGRLSWDTLRTLFVSFNTALQGRLVLCMSTCYGAAAHQLVKNSTDNAFYALVGPMARIGWHDGLVAFVAFYQLVVNKGAEPMIAAQTMNLAAGLPEKTFVAVQGDAVRAYHKQREYREALQQAARAFADSLASRGK